MFTRLLPSQYPAVLPLFGPLDFNLVIRSVAAGNTPAWVYVDSENTPHTALIWDCQDAILVAGESGLDARAALRAVFLDGIAENARPRGIPEFALQATPAWDALIPEILPELTPNRAKRYSYRLHPADFRPLPDIAEGFALAPIDEELLNSHLHHIDDVRGWIDSFWHSQQDFLRTGYSYCAIHEHDIAAWCLTVFAAGHERELGLATVPEYRQRGLATQVAAACLEYCLSQDHDIHWHCWADNLPSARTAEKLGFHLEREYWVHHLHL